MVATGRLHSMSVRTRKQTYRTMRSTSIRVSSEVLTKPTANDMSSLSRSESWSADSAPRESNPVSDREQEPADRVHAESSEKAPTVTTQSPLESCENRTTQHSSSSQLMDLADSPPRVRSNRKSSLLEMHRERLKHRCVIESLGGDEVMSVEVPVN